MNAERRPLQLEKTKTQLDQMAWLMDNCFRIPGLGWRFGIEALIGLVPGLGDIVSGVIGLVLLVRAFQFRLPKVVVARMLLNTVADLTIGSVPFFGDAFDFFWKSNTRNMALFHEYAGEPAKDTRRHWIFLGSIVIGFILLFIVVLALIFWLLSVFVSRM